MLHKVLNSYFFLGSQRMPNFALLTGLEDAEISQKHFAYSNSTKTNAFCLGIILCNVSRSFDYLIYPYYPAYTS